MSFNSYYGGLSNGVRGSMFQTLRRSGLKYSNHWSEFRIKTLGRIPPNTERLGERFAESLAFFDLLLFYFQKLVRASFLHMHWIPKGDGASSFRFSAHATIASRVFTDLVAIRMLVLSGLDVQARQLARTMSENLDALALTTLNEEFCAAFVQSQDPNSSSATWFRFIAKGKARKQLYAFIDSKGGEKATAFWRDFRDHEEPIFSMAAHPNHAMGFLTFVPHLGDQTMSDDWGRERDVSSASLRTLLFCTVRCLEYSCYEYILFRYAELLIDSVPRDFESVHGPGVREAVFAIPAASADLTDILLNGPARDLLPPNEGII